MIYELLGFIAAVCIASIIAIGVDGEVPFWAALPLTICGGLSLGEVFRLLGKRLNVVSVRAVLGPCLAVFCFISPFCQLAWDYWPALPYDSRSPGSIAIWCWSWVLGLIVYRFLFFKEPTLSAVHAMDRAISRHRFAYCWTGLLLISVGANLVIYSRFGGVGGFVETFSSRSGGLIGGVDPYEGQGIIVAIADGSRFLLAIGMAYIGRHVKGGRSWVFFGLSCLVLFLLFLLLGGLRGSRGTTVYAMFCYVVIYNFWVRRLPVTIAAIGLVSLFLFMTGYSYYKFKGKEGIVAALSGQYVDLGRERVDATMYVIARDLGRMDMQVLAIKRKLFDGNQVAWGRSYLGAPFSVVPDALPGPKPATVTKEKVELLFGEGMYSSAGPRQTSLLMGQYGELVVNFGLVGIPLFFGVWLFAVARCRRWLSKLSWGDPRAIFAPAVILVPVQLLMYDSSLLVMFYFKLLLFPSVLYYLVVSSNDRSAEN